MDCNQKSPPLLQAVRNNPSLSTRRGFVRQQGIFCSMFPWKPTPERVPFRKRRRRENADKHTCSPQLAESHCNPISRSPEARWGSARTPPRSNASLDARPLSVSASNCNGPSIKLLELWLYTTSYPSLFMKGSNNQKTHASSTLSLLFPFY